MTFEERNTASALLVNLCTTGYMIVKLRDLHESGAFDAPDALATFGKTVLWLIPFAIVLTIVVTIAFNIIFAILSGDGNPSFVKDERDNLFQTRAHVVTMIVLGFGFIGTMAGLAFGWSAIAGFTLLYFSCAAGDFIGNLVRMVSYRIGV